MSEVFAVEREENESDSQLSIDLDEYAPGERRRTTFHRRKTLRSPLEQDKMH